jgi:predicted double-glycine peptidase
MRPEIKVRSYLDIRTHNIVMQQFDYSCGAAALATLMSYYFDDNTTEKNLLEIARQLSTVNQQQLRKKGLSLLDLKKIAEHKDYRAAGFRLDITQLKKLTGPVLIYYEPNDYQHFAVLKRVSEQYVYIADPARGNVRDLIYKFDKEWHGIVLALENPATAIKTSATPAHNNFSIESHIANRIP